MLAKTVIIIRTTTEQVKTWFGLLLNGIKSGFFSFLRPVLTDFFLECIVSWLHSIKLKHGCSLPWDIESLRSESTYCSSPEMVFDQGFRAQFEVHSFQDKSSSHYKKCPGKIT